MGAPYGDRVGLTLNAFASAGRLGGKAVALLEALSEESLARSASAGSLSREGIEGKAGAGIPISGKVESGSGTGMGPARAGLEMPDREVSEMTGSQVPKSETPGAPRCEAGFGARPASSKLRESSWPGSARKNALAICVRVATSGRPAAAACLSALTAADLSSWIMGSIVLMVVADLNVLEHA